MRLATKGNEDNEGILFQKMELVYAHFSTSFSSFASVKNAFCLPAYASGSALVCAFCAILIVVFFQGPGSRVADHFLLIGERLL